MLPETYEPMPSYRLVTSDGVCQLTETLLEKVKAAVIEEENKLLQNSHTGDGFKVYRHTLRTLLKKTG